MSIIQLGRGKSMTLNANLHDTVVRRKTNGSLTTYYLVEGSAYKFTEAYRKNTVFDLAFYRSFIILFILLGVLSSGFGVLGFVPSVLSQDGEHLTRSVAFGVLGFALFKVAGYLRKKLPLPYALLPLALGPIYLGQVTHPADLKSGEAAPGLMFEWCTPAHRDALVASRTESRLKFDLLCGELLSRYQALDAEAEAARAAKREVEQEKASAEVEILMSELFETSTEEGTR